MFYVFRYNASLAALGISPSRVNPDMRVFAQNMGSKFGLTPQEAVLMTLTQFPITVQEEVDPAFIQVWVDEGKVDLRKEDVQEALSRLGWTMRAKI